MFEQYFFKYFIHDLNLPILKITMKSKILFASLALVSMLFLWQYLIVTKNTPSKIADTPLAHNDGKTNLFDTLISPIASIETKTNNSSTIKTQNPKTVKHVVPPSALKAPPSYTEILNILTKAKENKTLNAVALTWKLESCSECLNSLKEILADTMQDQNVRTNAALVLAKIGSQESVIALIQTLHENATLASESQFFQNLAAKSIRTIREPEGIGALAYILTGQQESIITNQLSVLLTKIMTKAITSYADKEGVAYEITQQYWQTQNPEVQKAIIALNHPQTLALLAIDAKVSGDASLQNNVIEKLIENPHGDSLDALMSLAKDNQNTELPTQITQWTQKHIGTNWQEHLIDYLSNPQASAAQREIAVISLKNIIQTPNLVSQQKNLQIQQALNKYQQQSSEKYNSVISVIAQ